MLPERFLTHWTALVVVIRYLSGASIARDSTNSSTASLSSCDDWIKQWLRQIPRLYGEWALTLGVHLLNHLARYVRLFGPIWAINCFAFESFNSRIKRTIHSRKGGQHEEFAKAFVTNLSLHEKVDQYVSAANEELCALFHELGFSPIDYSNARLKKTWVPVPAAPVPTFLVEKRGTIEADEWNSAMFQQLNSAPSRIQISTMLFRNGTMFYSTSHLTQATANRRFSNCSLVQFQNGDGAIVESPAVLRRFFLVESTGRAYVEADIPTLEPWTLPMSTIPFARLCPATFSASNRYVLPVESLVRKQIWIHVPGKFGTGESDYAYILDYVHLRSMDPSVPLRRQLITQGMLLSEEIM